MGEAKLLGWLLVILLKLLLLHLHWWWRDHCGGLGQLDGLRWLDYLGGLLWDDLLDHFGWWLDHLNWWLLSHWDGHLRLMGHHWRWCLDHWGWDLLNDSGFLRLIWHIWLVWLHGLIGEWLDWLELAEVGDAIFLLVFVDHVTVGWAGILGGFNSLGLLSDLRQFLHRWLDRGGVLTDIWIRRSGQIWPLVGRQGRWILEASDAIGELVGLVGVGGGLSGELIDHLRWRVLLSLRGLDGVLDLLEIVAEIWHHDWLREDIGRCHRLLHFGHGLVHFWCIFIHNFHLRLLNFFDGLILHLRSWLGGLSGLRLDNGFLELGLELSGLDDLRLELIWLIIFLAIFLWLGELVGAALGGILRWHGELLGLVIDADWVRNALLLIITSIRHVIAWWFHILRHLSLEILEAILDLSGVDYGFFGGIFNGGGHFGLVGQIGLLDGEALLGWTLLLDLIGVDGLEWLDWGWLLDLAGLIWIHLVLNRGDINISRVHWLHGFDWLLGLKLGLVGGHSGWREGV